MADLSFLTLPQSSSTPATPSSIKPISTSSNLSNLTLPSNISPINTGLLQGNNPLTVPAPKPTSVVSSQTAVNTANNIKNNIITPADQRLNAGNLTQAQADERDAQTTPDMKFLTGSGKPNPNYVAPKSETPIPPANPIEQAQTDQILHPGQQNLFNTRTGLKEWVDTTSVAGGIPSGYSAQDPKTRTDVSDSIQDADGTTIDKLSDGTYRRVDINGNYTLGTQAMFDNAKRVNDLNTALDNARKGIYSPSQKAQLDSIQKNYDELIRKQGVQNANTTGGTTIAMNRYGLGNQIVGQQQIDKTVTDGIQSIADLTTQRDDAINKMKLAFETDDTNALKSAFDIYNISSQNIQKQIDKTQTAIQSAKDKQTLANTSNAISMANKYIDVTDPILSTDTPEQVREKVKTSPIWQAEQKQKSGLVDQEAVDGAFAIWQKTNQLPTGFSAMSQNLKNAIYKKIGGNPDSVDEAVVNKAILTGKTKALSTQENQLAGATTSIKTLDKTLDLAQEYSNKVDRTGSPFFAKYANYLKGTIKGDADTAAFQALMKTAANEYAKIMSGAASSISGSTVSSVQDAESIINAEMSKGQISEVMDILRKDANFRLSSQKDTIKSLNDDIKNIGGTSTGSSSTSGGSDFDW